MSVDYAIEWALLRAKLGKPHTYNNYAPAVGFGEPPPGYWCALVCSAPNYPHNWQINLAGPMFPGFKAKLRYEFDTFAELLVFLDHPAFDFLRPKSGEP